MGLSGSTVSVSGGLTGATPSDLPTYRPIRLDAACHNAVGSFTAAGVALVSVNLLAGGASAEDIGGISLGDFDRRPSTVGLRPCGGGWCGDDCDIGHVKLCGVRLGDADIECSSLS